MVSHTVIILLLIVALLIGLTIVAWRYRTKQGAKLFGFLQATSAAWAGFTALGLSISPGTPRLRVWAITTGLSLLVIILWLGFIFSYTGRTHWLTVRRFGVVSVPLVISAGLYFLRPTQNPLVSEVTQQIRSVGTVVAVSLSPIGGVIAVYIYLIFLVGLGIVIKTALEGSRLFIGQALAFVGGSLVTIIASLLVILGIPTEGYPLTQVALGGQAVLWGYAVFGQQLLQLVPAVAEIGEQAVFSDLADGILVVDNDGIVVRANPRARSYLDTSDPVGDPVTALLGIMGVETIKKLPTRFEYKLQTYQADASRIRNWQEEPVGYAVTIRDITPLVTREQQLEVLNRILRHNVRNDMNIVQGIGERLQAYDDEETREFGTTLRQTAKSLTSVSRKAIQIDRLFDKSIVTEQVDLSALIDEVVSPLVEEYPDATIEVTVTAETVGTDPGIISSVLEEVVTNALEHAGDAPTICIEVIRVGEEVEITVSDDGPGIPQAEIDPITAGEETPLEHATSMGIWFIDWGIQALGGEADFETSSTGTRVRLRVPDRRESE